MSRRLLAAVAAAALTCGISACTEGQESARTDPPADVVADAPSDGGGESPVSDGGGDAEGADAADGSTSAAADLPAPDPADFPGMDENTPEGAEQAVRFFFANVYWGYQVGDPSGISNRYSEKCEACVEFEDRLSAIPGDGAWGEVEVKEVGVIHEESANFDIEVGYMYKVGKHAEPSVDGGTFVSVEEAGYTAAVGLDWEGDNWIIGGMTFGRSHSDG
ncbi:MAG: DUF6318 family protein [Brachybacterium alimentarium]